MLSLLAAGEFDVILNAHGRGVKKLAKKGARIAWTFPRGPVFVSISTVGAVKNSPHPNAAKLFLTYWTSKEGQIARYEIEGHPPTHPDLISNPKYLAWPDEFANRKIIVPSLEERFKALRAARKYWKKLWLGG